MYSSIYHFFGSLLSRRGHLSQFKNLEEFELPDTMIAARNKGTFPDVVLRHDPNAELTGGEFIELKTAKSYSIPSFNSTLPTKQKKISSLSEGTRDKLVELGESFDQDEDRRVFYLLVGRKPKAVPAPLTKVCLVSGGFFETKPPVEVISDAATQAMNALHTETDESIRAWEQTLSAADVQKQFAASRRVEGSAIKIRFRVMAEAHPDANLMRQERFPLIGDDTISFISEFDDALDVSEQELVPLADIKSELRDSKECMNLSMALDDIDLELKNCLKLGVFSHPFDGPYFIAQASI